MSYRFRNHYECPCGTTWCDEWDATCDDRCPSCDTSCSPHHSDDLPEQPPTDSLTVDGLEVPVRVLSRRTVYGRNEALVTPIGGKGEQWVTVTRLVSWSKDPEVPRVEG